MYFDKILDHFKCGKKIRRASWPIGVMLDRNNDRGLNIKDLLADDWQVIEYKTWWAPKEDEEDLYYIINDGIDYCFYNNDDTDKFLMSIGNCFQTKEQAEFMVEKLKVIHELKKFAFENNEKEIDFNKPQTRHFICYDIRDKTVDIDWSSSLFFMPFNIYFTSEELAKKAIETIGEERIKKYYFGVKENEEN